jgi:hypothetical protein
MNDHDKDVLSDADMEALFATIGDDIPQMSDGFLDRIVADAALLQVSGEVFHPPLGMWGRALDALGGWPSLGGLATATVAGIYIGFADPTVLETVGLFETSETGDVLLGDFAFFDDVTEG